MGPLGRGIARRARVLGTAGVALLVASLASGCVVLNGTGAGQPLTIIGDYRVAATICASGSGPSCSDLGNAGLPAATGAGQVLVGLRVPGDVVPAPTATSSGPEPLAFSQSPGYAAELERLAPAPPGSRWVGYISAVTDYSMASGPQSVVLEMLSKLPQGADGGPFASPVDTSVTVGGRAVGPAAPGTRPVACGPSLTALFDEDPSPASEVVVICVDSQVGFTARLRDLGILAAGARASGRPGTLAILPYTLRYAGNAVPGADFGLTATSALAGAALAVTPGSLIPAADSDAQALVAVGIPEGARPGTYDVTLTARHSNGQTRRGVGRLSVLGEGGATSGGGTAARLRLTAALPRRLRAIVARRRGIVLLLGATEPAVARVRLFRGPATTPVASARVRLRVPGPTRVVLRSTRLRTGDYRIVITGGGRTLVRRTVLTR